MPEINEEEFYTMVEIDCSTGQATKRRLTAEERADLDKQRELYENERAIAAAAEAERVAEKNAAILKLQALGLSESEIKALTGN